VKKSNVKKVNMHLFFHKQNNRRSLLWW